MALRAPPVYFEELTGAYRRRRDFLVAGLVDAGFDVRAPEGTYFVMADFRPFGFDDDVRFAKFLVEKIGVAAIPPTSFYENKDAGRFMVRFAFCKTRAVLEAGVERLAALR